MRDVGVDHPYAGSVALSIFLHPLLDASAAPAPPDARFVAAAAQAPSSVVSAAGVQVPVAPAVALPTGDKTDDAAAGAPQGETGLQAVVLFAGTDLAAAALQEAFGQQAVARQGGIGLQAEAL